MSLLRVIAALGFVFVAGCDQMTGKAKEEPAADAAQTAADTADTAATTADAAAGKPEGAAAKPEGAAKP